MTDPSSSPNKKRRILPPQEQTDAAADDDVLQSILESWLGKDGSATGPPPEMQCLLDKGNNNKIRQDLYKLQELFDEVGFRTSIVQSPRLAVSLYKDSCVLLQQQSSSEDRERQQQQQQQQRDYLLTMLGLHPDQEKRENYYKHNFRESNCSHQFLARIKLACRKATKEPIVKEWIDNHHQRQQKQQQNSATTTASSTTTSLDVRHLMKLLLKVDPKLRQEQLDHEMERIGWYNCTLSNALMQQFLHSHHSCVVRDVFFKTSHVAKYERITFYLYDPQIDLIKPSGNFIFLPDLARALQPRQLSQPQPQPTATAQQQDEKGTTKDNKNIIEQCGTRAIVQDMMTTFWSHLLRHAGYYASAAMKQQLSPALERYFVSGLRQDPKVPLKLMQNLSHQTSIVTIHYCIPTALISNAHFDPCEPISLYLWGKAGAGKSSFVRHVPSAIQAAVETHADPELLVRFVKQTLNKPYKDLCLELELRPNNNDLSVMSIIQSRKCTMTQSKPGLVVIGLEEMPKYYLENEQHDPNQVHVCQLISQRFGGRKGEFDSTRRAPRNSEKRGIGNDASLITLFTSNYSLEQPSREALQRLPMFQHLTVVQMTAISGKDRSDFAFAYFQQSINDRIQQQQHASSSSSSHASASRRLKTMDIPLGDGDTRPLVRHLRMLAYYASAVILAENGGNNNDSYEISVTQKDKFCKVVVGDQPALDLQVGTLDNLFPVKPKIFDPRTDQVMNNLRTKTTMTDLLSEESLDELSTILDFWLGDALTPAVILSQKASLVETLISVIETTLTAKGDGYSGKVQCLSNIEAGSHKMMKSLYDPRDTPNLRDDILKLGGGRRPTTVGGGGGGAGGAGGSSSSSTSTLVAMHLKCGNTDAQLCLREMLEDTPSMTAFSSDRSALYKNGLLFAVHIDGGCDITPELKSRASLIL